MELHQLRYFLAVARHHHFSRAAQELRVAQPSVSQQIQKLESELGVRLLDRTRGGVVLTEAGQAFLPRAQHALEQLQEARLELEELSGLRRGHLALGATPSVGAHVLPAALAAFRARHPGIQLNVRQAGSLALLQQVAAGELDVAIAILPFNEPTLEALPLFTDELVLAVPPGHPLEHAPSIPLRALAAEPFVLYQEGYDLREVVLAACRRAGFEPRVALEGGETDSVPRFVAAGLGVAILPRMVAEGMGEPPWVRLSEPRLTRTLGLAWRRDRYQSSASRAFQALFKAFVSERLKPTLLESK
ncbi:MAG: LysR family transcriptional regulator [Chloroflexi bacterium]|nr:LysR family transcriptional regulator [Chloroflexota bacterium]